MNEPTVKTIVPANQNDKSDLANVSSTGIKNLKIELGSAFRKEVNLDVSALMAIDKIQYFKDPIVPEVVKFDYAGSSVCSIEICKAEMEFAPILANNTALLFRSNSSNPAFQIKSDTTPVEELHVEGDKTKLTRQL